MRCGRCKRRSAISTFAKLILYPWGVSPYGVDIGQSLAPRAFGMCSAVTRGVKTLALTGGVLLCPLRNYHLFLFEGSA
jgi:hypothetical protein